MPRLLVTADLHFLPTFAAAVRTAIEDEAQRLAAAGTPPDAVVIAGDLGDMIDAKQPGKDTRELLRTMRRAFPGIPIAFCAGNHDVWIDPRSGMNSWDVYTRGLHQLAREEYTHYLDTMGPLVLPGATIVGSMGHYDYSLAEPGLTMGSVRVERKHYAKKTPPGWLRPLFNDAAFIQWEPLTDETATQRIGEQFARDLQRAAARAEPTLIVTHTVPDARLNAWTAINRETGDPAGLFLSAFSGTTHTGELIRRHCGDLATRVPVLAACGHTHQRIERYQDAGIAWWNVGADYGEPRFDLIDLE
ncbi:MAG: metallophosphoesterase [Planctomycetota bacterium]